MDTNVTNPENVELTAEEIAAKKALDEATETEEETSTETEEAA
jgi:hypothetical protein